MGASDDIIALYNTHALAFAKARGHALVEKDWLDRFLALIPPNASILDLGCGSGEPIARYLIERGYDLTGIDASLPLIEMCRETFPQSHWQVADMRQLALGRRFDGLIVWHSLFHLKPDDQRRVFGIFHAHAKDGAALMFTAGPREGEVIGSFENRPLYHASLDRIEYEALLSEHGFRLLDHVVADETCGGATVYLAERDAA